MFSIHSGTGSKFCWISNGYFFFCQVLQKWKRGTLYKLEQNQYKNFWVTEPTLSQQHLTVPSFCAYAILFNSYLKKNFSPFFLRKEKHQKWVEHYKNYQFTLKRGKKTKKVENSKVLLAEVVTTMLTVATRVRDLADVSVEGSKGETMVSQMLANEIPKPGDRIVGPGSTHRCWHRRWVVQWW